jgi:hypothetical protein
VKEMDDEKHTENVENVSDICILYVFFYMEILYVVGLVSYEQYTTTTISGGG